MLQDFSKYIKHYIFLFVKEIRKAKTAFLDLSLQKGFRLKRDRSLNFYAFILRIQL